MANTTQDAIYEMFLALAPSLGQPTSNPMVSASEEIQKSATTISNAAEAVAETLNRVTPVTSDTTGRAISSKATTSADNSESAVTSVVSSLFGAVPLGDALMPGKSDSGSIVGTIASTVLKSGLGIVPLIGSLIGLFGGGESDAPAPLVKYALPPSLAFQGAQGEFGLDDSDYDQSGLPRQWSSWRQRASSTSDPRSSSSSQPAQITVNVNAMDARSFLDRSSDIAAAVRDAMLNLNSINDVVNEL